jgi:transmembrane sensor
MKNLIQFPRRQRADEEACAWIARLDRHLTVTEERELTDWLKVPANRDALIEVSALWEDLDVLQELSALFPLRDEQTPDEQPERKWWLRPAVAAASFACIFMSAWFLFSGTFDDSFNEPGVSVTQSRVAFFATGVGKMRTIDLEDGTIIVLNTDTQLQVEYSATARQIRLRRGEAHFDVAPDENRPFSVYAGSHVLNAVGTVFNVEERPGDVVELIVTEGEVRVVAGADDGAAATPNPPGGRFPMQASVLAGEAAVISPGRQSVAVIDAEEVSARLSWQQSMLLFRGETLDDVLAEFARYSPIPLELTDSTLGAIPVVGYFNVSDLDALFLLLSENFDIEAERHDGRITLRAR